MPFTISHAAVAAPLARRGLILSAVAVGSMAPDFEYFLRLSMNSRWSHTLPGLLTFALPVSLLVLWVFHAFLKRPLIAVLPAAHRERLETVAGPFAFGPWRRFVRIAASLLVGVGSHLMFDAWTHDHGLVVRHWALLRQPLLDWPTYRMPVHDVMQGGLSVIMLLAIVVQYWGWFRRTTPAPAPLTAFLDVRAVLMAWTVLGTIALACGLVYAAATVTPIHDALSFRVFCGRVVLAGLSALVVACVVFGWSRGQPRAGCACRVPSTDSAPPP